MRHPLLHVLLLAALTALAATPATAEGPDRRPETWLPERESPFEGRLKRRQARETEEKNAERPARWQWPRRGLRLSPRLDERLFGTKLPDPPEPPGSADPVETPTRAKAGTTVKVIEDRAGPPPLAGHAHRSAVDGTERLLRAGDVLRPGDVYVKLNPGSYGLPDAPVGQVYARLGRQVVLLDTVLRRVTSVLPAEE